MQMKQEYYITITGTSHYYGMRPFSVGKRFKCVKEPSNPYDGEAIDQATGKDGGALEGTGGKSHPAVATLTNLQIDLPGLHRHHSGGRPPPVQHGLHDYRCRPQPDSRPRLHLPSGHGRGGGRHCHSHRPGGGRGAVSGLPAPAAHSPAPAPGAAPHH